MKQFCCLLLLREYKCFQKYKTLLIHFQAGSSLHKENKELGGLADCHLESLNLREAFATSFVSDCCRIY